MALISFVIILAGIISVTSLAPRPPLPLQKWHYEPRYELHVKNGLPGREEFSTHCWSRDDDLGFHRIYPGMDYNFGFAMDIIEMTRFTCDFWKGTKHIQHTLFNKTIAYPHCGYSHFGVNLCYWQVKKDGFYLNNVFMYDWDNKGVVVEAAAAAVVEEEEGGAQAKDE